MDNDLYSHLILLLVYMYSYFKNLSIMYIDYVSNIDKFIFIILNNNNEEVEEEEEFNNSVLLNIFNK